MKKFIIDIWKSLLTQTWLSQSAPGQLLDLHVDAGVAEPLEHDLRGLDVVGIVRRRLEDDLEFARTVASLGEQRLGLGDVLRAVLERAVVRARRRDSSATR